MRELIINPGDESMLRSFLNDFGSIFDYPRRYWIMFNSDSVADKLGRPRTSCDGGIFYAYIEEEHSPFPPLNGPKPDTSLCSFNTTITPIGLRVKFFTIVGEDDTDTDYVIDLIILSAEKYGFKITEIDEYGYPISDYKNFGTLDNLMHKMTEWRIRRGNIFKELKDNDTSLSKTKLALNATLEAKRRIKASLLEKDSSGSLKEIDSEVLAKFKEEYHTHKDEFDMSDVRNDYADFGWEWVDTRKLK